MWEITRDYKTAQEINYKTVQKITKRNYRRGLQREITRQCRRSHFKTVQEKNSARDYRLRTQERQERLHSIETTIRPGWAGELDFLPKAMQGQGYGQR